MGACAMSDSCVFNQVVGSSVVKRIRYASAYPYCRGEKSGQCALLPFIQRGEGVPRNLMPDGSFGDYLEDSTASVGPEAAPSTGSIKRFLVVDDSMVFATIATNVIRQRFGDVEVVQCHSFSDAEPELRRKRFTLIVSGHGVGEGRTVRDVRSLNPAPIVVFTGRPLDGVELPANSKVVTKAAGPTALREAMEQLVGA